MSRVFPCGRDYPYHWRALFPSRCCLCGARLRLCPRHFRRTNCPFPFLFLYGAACAGQDYASVLGTPGAPTAPFYAAFRGSAPLTIRVALGLHPLIAHLRLPLGVQPSPFTLHIRAIRPDYRPLDLLHRVLLPGRSRPILSLGIYALSLPFLDLFQIYPFGVTPTPGLPTSGGWHIVRTSVRVALVCHCLTFG